MGKSRVATTSTEPCRLLVPGGRGELWTSSGVHTGRYLRGRMEPQGQLPWEPDYRATNKPCLDLRMRISVNVDLCCCCLP